MSAAKPVWIDTDTAIGVPGADVDDGLALIQAFHSPELSVRGVSSVFGNAPLEQTHAMAREVVARFGPPGLRVARGAASAAERGAESEASRALAEALRAQPLHLIALGPLTNVATLLEREPALADRLLSLVMVAARRPGQRFLSHPAQPAPFPDLNFDCDPVAMQRVLDSPAALVFAPWEVSAQVWIGADALDRLARGGDSGRYVAEHARPWLGFWQRELRAPGFNPFDTLAIAALSHPHWLARFRCGVWIEDGPDDTAPAEAQARGATKPHLLVDAARLARPGARAAEYCFRPHPEFLPLLLERLAAPARAT